MAKIRNGSSSRDRILAQPLAGAYSGHPWSPACGELCFPSPPTTALSCLGHLTGHSLAAVGVTAAGGVALHTQTLVAAVGVDAALAAGEGGAALVHISTSAAVILRPEAGSAAALQAQGALAGDGAGVWASP